MSASLPNKRFHMIMEGDVVKCLRLLPDDSLDLVVSSPPYNVGKEYETNISMEEYDSFIYDVLEQCFRVLKTGGRICWNVPNQIRLWGDSELWSPSILSANLLAEVGFKFYDYLIWDQGFSMSGCAWGSYMSASSPFIKHRTEAILVFSKGPWKIPRRGKSDIDSKTFIELTRSELWRMQPESSREHPAPFPEELALRCMKLFSYDDAIVLDPFGGSGTTSKAAQATGRSSIYVDYKSEYVESAKKRIGFGHPTMFDEIEWRYEKVA